MEKGYLRAAVEADMDLLFAWANDPVVRSNSFSTAEISYAEHVQWYHRLLDREDAKQYIYMRENVPVGQIRVTIEGDTAEIGYSVCEHERGKGYGKHMLQLIAEQLRQDFPMVTKLVGKVKPENISSQNAFLRAGYTEAYRAFEQKIGD